jgi:uncharacterized membrane-anchored protein YhcB (DUF1043 family)
MAEKDWTLVVIGLLVGIPIGIALLWAFTRFRGGSSATYQLAPKTTYINTEEWEILKDERGRTRGIRVHRRAQEA